MTFAPRRVAVVGATGPTGIHLARELAARGRRVVAVSRRRGRLEELFAQDDVEIAVADALDPAATHRAVGGCDLVVDCIGLPPERMRDHVATARVISTAARDAGARCLQVSSYWSFFPQTTEVMNEAHPRRGGHEWFRMRREAEDAMLAAGAAVVHLPDFFGPFVHTSAVQRALEEAVAGKPVSWMGRAQVAREVAFVPDAMRIVANLAEHERAYGTDWSLPGNGLLTAARLVAIASDHLGRAVALRAAPEWLLRALALVSPTIRKIRPLVPQYARPVRYGTSKLRGLLGEVETRPLEQAIRETLDWLARERASTQVA